MIGISFASWSHSKFYEVFGGYMIAKRYYHKGKWTPIIFLRYKRYTGSISHLDDDKITWGEVKQVCTSLDNVFYGSMVFAALGILYWFWMLMGIWLFAAPVLYMAVCYIGLYTKLYVKSKGYDTGKSQQDEADSIQGPSV